MTLHAIRKTRGRMHIGISESRTHKILNEEMSKVGLIDGDGLVLFGGQSFLLTTGPIRDQIPSQHLHRGGILTECRERCYAPWGRIG